jgi:hypothetical protein
MIILTVSGKLTSLSLSSSMIEDCNLLKMEVYTPRFAVLQLFQAPYIETNMEILILSSEYQV